MPIRLQSFPGRSCWNPLSGDAMGGLASQPLQKAPRFVLGIVTGGGHLQPIVLQQRSVGKLAVSNDIFWCSPRTFSGRCTHFDDFFRWVGKNHPTRKVLPCFFLNGNCGVGIVRWFESRVIKWGTPTLIARMNGTFEGSSLNSASGWWFQRFFIFTPIWGRFPIWLIFFRWVETTN